MQQPPHRPALPCPTASLPTQGPRHGAPTGTLRRQSSTRSLSSVILPEEPRTASTSPGPNRARRGTSSTGTSEPRCRTFRDPLLILDPTGLTQLPRDPREPSPRTHRAELSRPVPAEPRRHRQWHVLTALAATGTPNTHSPGAPPPRAADAVLLRPPTPGLCPGKNNTTVKAQSSPRRARPGPAKSSTRMGWA